jgi:hypothetical protein
VNELVPAAGHQPPSPRRGNGSPIPYADLQIQVGRWNENELILFLESRRESWIVYPPRSAYEFVRRPSSDAAIVELHPWSAMVEPVQHAVRPREGCVLHGLDCTARDAIQAAIDTGFDPFK